MTLSPSAVGTFIWRAQTTAMAKHARAEVLWAHQLEFFVRQVGRWAHDELQQRARGCGGCSLSHVALAVAASLSIIMMT